MGYEVFALLVSDKKLRKLLIERDMIRHDLREATGVSTDYVAKLGKNQNVSTDILARICKALSYNISDICEIIGNNAQGGTRQ